MVDRDTVMTVLLDFSCFVMGLVTLEVSCFHCQVFKVAYPLLILTLFGLIR